MSGFFETPCWKKTALGSAIPLFSSHPLSAMAGKLPFLFIGGVHGDEPEGVRLGNELCAWLKEAKPNTAWILIPCLNIDGFRAKTRGNGRGVDLNRNYPAKSWSSEAKSERYHPGPFAGSEPEVQGVVELLQQQKPRLVVHFHSWKPCVVYAGEPARPYAQEFARSSGYALQDDIGYPTPGSLSQFGWADNRIPIICIEENDELGDPDSIWPRFRPAFEKIFSEGAN